MKRVGQKSRVTAYLGIDVACSKSKRLPLCFVEYEGRRLVPLSIPRELRKRIPRGLGNVEIKSEHPFRFCADQLANALLEIAEECGWNIQCAAVDAPAAHPNDGSRACERALSSAGISCFYTPNRVEWLGIIDECRKYLGAGKPVGGMPNANRVWMLYGFEIFRALRASGLAVIETYPQAIVRHLLGDDCPSKLTKAGLAMQLGAVARATGWDPQKLEDALHNGVTGSRHDKLDAFMAAWVAALKPGKRRAYGDKHNGADAIWVPNGKGT